MSFELCAFVARSAPHNINIRNCWAVTHFLNLDVPDERASVLVGQEAASNERLLLLAIDLNLLRALR